MKMPEATFPMLSLRPRPIASPIPPNAAASVPAATPAVLSAIMVTMARQKKNAIETSGRWIDLPFFKNLDDSLTDIPADHIPDNKYDNCFKKIDSPVESKIF